MILFNDWHFWLSIITASVAVGALWQTHIQIKLSNKQHFFDRRIENYIIAKGLIELYESNYKILNDKKDEPLFSVDLEFLWLTNNSYLEQISSAIKTPLKDPSHREFLLKLENMKDIATKINFLFSSNKAVLLKNFVMHYQELLYAMYKYKILLDDIEKANDNDEHTVKFEEYQERFREKEHREELQKAFDNLNQAYSLLKKLKVESKIEKQIRLKNKVLFG